MYREVSRQKSGQSSMCIVRKKKRKEESPTPTQRSDQSLRTAISGGQSHYSHYSGHEASTSPEAQAAASFTSATTSPAVAVPSTNLSPSHPPEVQEPSAPPVLPKQSLTQPSLIQHSSAPQPSDGSPPVTKRKGAITESLIHSRPASPEKAKPEPALPAPPPVSVPKRQPKPSPAPAPAVTPPKKIPVRRIIDQVREANDPAYGTLSPYKSEWESAEIVKFVDLKVEDRKKEEFKKEEAAKKENRKESRKSKKSAKKRSSREAAMVA